MTLLWRYKHNLWRRGKTETSWKAVGIIGSERVENCSSPVLPTTELKLTTVPFPRFGDRFLDVGICREVDRVLLQG